MQGRVKVRGESKAALGGGLVKHRQPGMEQRKREGTAPEKTGAGTAGTWVIRGLHGKNRNGCTVRADRGLGVSGKVQESGPRPRPKRTVWELRAGAGIPSDA